MRGGANTQTGSGTRGREEVCDLEKKGGKLLNK